MDPTAPLLIERLALDALHLDPANARTHPDENLGVIEASLLRFGQAEPLVVQASTGRVIGGNGRLVVMRKLGWTHADVVRLDVDDLTATSLGIALNRTSDTVKLLKELQDENALEGTGFNETDLDALVAELEQELTQEGEIDEDAVPEPPAAAVSRLGDIWVLGRHRLMCGDSGAHPDVDALVNGAPIHLVNTDPPYNVRVEPRSNNAIAAGLSSFAGDAKKGKRRDVTAADEGGMHHQGFDLARHKSKSRPTSKRLRPKDRPLMNDFVKPDDFDAMLLAWFGNIARVLVPGGGFYIWGGYANCANYPGALKETGLYFSQAVIWVKEHPVLTRKDFMGNHEWCFYGWKEGAAHRFFGPANIPDVWSVKKVNPQGMVHLTEKPVELARRAIHYSSRTGENILDLFGGSGSTLIAAETTNRNAYLMEMDPLYCDVIIERWQAFTGKQAVLTDGTAFLRVRSERGM